MKFFLQSDKNQSPLQGDTIILSECNQACLKYPKKVYISMQYLHKRMGDEVDFCLQISAKVFYKMIVSLWVCVARQAQSTKNSQFAIFLQYLKESMKDEAEFLPADKC